MAKRHNAAKFGQKPCGKKKCKNDATHTTSGLCSVREYACDEHEEWLDRNADDGYMTEADHITWVRL